MTVHAAQDMVLELTKNTQTLQQQLKIKEAALAERKRRDDFIARMDRLINHKLEVKEEKVLKRQNSCDPLLDDHFDYQTVNFVNYQLRRRNSLPRLEPILNHTNHVVKDSTRAGQERL